MDIMPLGHASFLLKGRQAKVVTDPFDPQMVGLKFPKKIVADMVTISHDHPDHNQIDVLEKGDVPPVIMKGPGEYEARGVEIVGIPSYHDTKNGQERGKNTIYMITIDGLTVVHLGDLGHKLTQDQEEMLGDPDILLVPVGGHYTIDAHTASAVVAQLEPRIIIPMHYQVPGLNPEIFKALTPVSVFLKEMGQETAVPQPKLTITRDKLPEEEQVVVLE